jgi:ATP-dependent DNA ligase
VYRLVHRGYLDRVITEPLALPLVAPMLAAAGSLPHEGGWAFEYKFDGVRALTYLDGGRVRMLSRNGNDVTGSYPNPQEFRPMSETKHSAEPVARIASLRDGAPDLETDAVSCI